MSNIEITLEGGGITDIFHNDWDECEARELLHIESLDGWYGGVGSTVTPDLKRFRRHGAFPGRTIRSTRKIDLVLSWHHSVSRNSDAAFTAAARIASSIAWDEGPYLMTVIEDGFELCANVQLDGEPQFQNIVEGGEDAFRIRLPLRATDPFLYSPPHTVQLSSHSRTPVLLTDWWTQGLVDAAGNQVLAWSEPAQKPGTLANSGTATAYPEVTIVADSSSGVELVLNGKTVQYAAPLFEQSPLTINYKTGSATMNGRDVSFNLRKREWSSVPAHTSSVMSMRLLGGTAAQGFGYATMRDTYI